MSEAIFAEDLTKTYGGKTVVDHLDISVKSGTGSVLLPIGVMFGTAALCTALAVRFFRWE